MLLNSSLTSSRNIWGILDTLAGSDLSKYSYFFTELHNKMYWNHKCLPGRWLCLTRTSCYFELGLKNFWRLKRSLKICCQSLAKTIFYILKENVKSTKKIYKLVTKTLFSALDGALFKLSLRFLVGFNL